jgi:hypothetical protein
MTSGVILGDGGIHIVAGLLVAMIGNGLSRTVTVAGGSVLVGGMREGIEVVGSSVFVLVGTRASAV